jgi:hypothetical protein
LKLIHPPEDREAEEELAWQRVLSCVRSIGPYGSLRAADLGDDGTALWALNRMGWERVCHEMESEKRAIWRAEFVRLYRAGRQTGAGCQYVPGLIERENRLKGHALTPALCGRPDWTELPAGEPETPALPAGETANLIAPAWELLPAEEAA